MQQEIKPNQNYHFHPLNPQKICCAEHVLELCTIFEQQGREQQSVLSILNFFESCETKFLLDENELISNTRKLIAKKILHYSLLLISQGDFDQATQLFENAQILVNSRVRADQDYVGIRATLHNNLAFFYEQQGDLETAFDQLKEANRLWKKINDEEGQVICRINMSHILMQLLNISEAIQLSQSTVKALENKIQIMSKGKGDSDLRKNTEFLDRVKLLLCAYNNHISCLSKISHDPYKTKELEESKGHAYKLSKRFLGTNNPLTQKFVNNIRPELPDFRVTKRKSSLRSNSPSQCSSTPQSNPRRQESETE